jgi:MltA-interacting protein MipA
VLVGQLSIAGALAATYASDDYMSDYFGIDAANAARSGLDRYSADAGFKDAGLDLVLGFGQGPGWRAAFGAEGRTMRRDRPAILEQPGSACGLGSGDPLRLGSAAGLSLPLTENQPRSNVLGVEQARLGIIC